METEVGFRVSVKSGDGGGGGGGGEPLPPPPHAPRETAKEKRKAKNSLFGWDNLEQAEGVLMMKAASPKCT
jgi:hypothetical protein